MPGFADREGLDRSSTGSAGAERLRRAERRRRGGCGGAGAELPRQPRPSSGMRAPVTAAAAGDASQTIASATSSGVVQPAVFAVG